MKIEYDPGIFEALCRMRSCVSKEEEVRPFVVFDDRTLFDLAQKVPRTYEELYDVFGLGEKRIERFGDPILNAIEAGLGQPIEACLVAE